MTNTDLKITVMGLGGIGGLLSGALIRRYGPAVSLIARGKRAESLRTNGLVLHSHYFGEFTVQPACVTDDPSTLPVQDIVLVCVKNGGLETAARQLQPIVGEDTLVLPVLNGVSASENLEKYLGRGHVLDSVIYTVSSAGEDFSITQLGNFTTIHMGAVHPEDAPRAAALCDVLKEAGIDCRLNEDIRAAIWNKYVLNCAYNVMTARHACTIGDVQKDPTLLAHYRGLMEEAYQVGVAMGVNLAPTLVEKNMKRLDKTDPASTSSLSRDFDAGIVGEMDIFTGDMIRMADACGTPIPLTRDYHQGLLERVARFGK